MNKKFHTLSKYLIITLIVSICSLGAFAKAPAKKDKAAKGVNSTCKATSCKANDTFTLYQLPSVADDHGDSYVIVTKNGKVIAIDGGKIAETNFLRGFLAAKGNHVTAWFTTHPHSDHVAAANAILKKPMGLKVDHVYHSRFTPEQLDVADGATMARAYYSTLDSLKNLNILEVTDCEPGMQFEIDGVNFKILSKRNPEITKNLTNNSSMAFRIWDDKKSIVNLGDLGVEGGNKLLNSEYKADLDCDYLKMPHHGQSCCDENFFKSINFDACLWPTPSWLWTCIKPNGERGPWTTLQTRQWMKDKGITRNYIMAEGMQIIK